MHRDHDHDHDGGDHRGRRPPRARPRAPRPRRPAPRPWPPPASRRRAPRRTRRRTGAARSSGWSSSRPAAAASSGRVAGREQLPGLAAAQHLAERVQVAGHDRGARPPSPRPARCRSSRRRCSARRTRRPSGSTRTLSASLTWPSITIRSRSPAGDLASASSASPGPATSSRRPGRCAASSSKARSRIGEALARLVHPAQEAERAARARPAGQRIGLLEPAHRDPVRDQDSVAAEVLDQRRPRRLGHRDPAADLLQRRLQDRLGHVQRARPRDGGVHGRHDRPVGDPAGQQATGWARPARARAGRRSRRPSPSAAPGSRTGSRTPAGPPSRCRAPAPRARPGPRSRAAAASSSAGAMTETSWPSSISASARPLTCSCTPPGTSQVYGQTRPILTRGSLPGRLGRAPAAALRGLGGGQPRRVEVGDEDPLQHVPVLPGAPGCPPRRSARPPASSPPPSASCPPRRAPGSPRRSARPSRSPSNHRTAGHQRRAGLHGQCRRTRHHPGLLAEELHLDAAAGDVPVGDQARRPCRPRSRWASMPNGLLPPLAGSTSMPRPSRKATNRSYTDSGFEPLHHGGEGARALGDDPCPGLIPVPHVREREDHAAAGRQVVEGFVESGRRRACRRPAAQPASPAAGRSPASTAHSDRMTSREAARSSAPVASGPSTRRRLASRTCTRGPCRRQAMSATNGTRLRPGLGHPADGSSPGRIRRRPADPSIGIRTQPRPLVPAADSRRLGWFPRARAGPSSGAPESRWSRPAAARRRRRWPGAGLGATARGQHPLPERERARRRQQPEPDGKDIRYAKPGQARGHKPDKQPLGPLGEAHVALQARGSRRAPWRTTPARRRPGRTPRPRPAAGLCRRARTRPRARRTRPRRRPGPGWSRGTRRTRRSSP